MHATITTFFTVQQQSQQSTTYQNDRDLKLHTTQNSKRARMYNQQHAHTHQHKPQLLATHWLQVNEATRQGDGGRVRVAEVVNW